MSHIFINLPVTDLDKAIGFYEAIGFKKNPQFSNEQGAAVAYDDNLVVMLLTHGFAQSFLPSHKTVADSHKTCEVLNALQFDNKEAVDSFVDKALAAWGKATIPAYDHGFMYGRDFEDTDGHIWEAFWMNPDGMPQQ